MSYNADMDIFYCRDFWSTFDDLEMFENINHAISQTNKYAILINICSFAFQVQASLLCIVYFCVFGSIFTLFYAAPSYDGLVIICVRILLQLKDHIEGVVTRNG